MDGRVFHCRQNRVTLNLTNIRERFPNACDIRVVPSNPKDRWAEVLAHTEQQRTERLLLMKYHPLAWEPITQPRLLSRLIPGITTIPVAA